MSKTEAMIDVPEIEQDIYEDAAVSVMLDTISRRATLMLTNDELQSIRRYVASVSRRAQRERQDSLVKTLRERLNLEIEHRRHAQAREREAILGMRIVMRAYALCERRKDSETDLTDFFEEARAQVFGEDKPT
jgi:hypothetical protein